MIGTFASSKAGHDLNQIYIILREDAEYVYLSDGKTKTVGKPKKKNKKHVQKIARYVSEDCMQKIINKSITDAEIIHELRLERRAQNVED